MAEGDMASETLDRGPRLLYDSAMMPKIRKKSSPNIVPHSPDGGAIMSPQYSMNLGGGSSLVNSVSMGGGSSFVNRVLLPTTQGASSAAFASSSVVGEEEGRARVLSIVELAWSKEEMANPT
ncbi:hypothetical protein Taro_016507 [Colocasia esculenta]|uniref:Uncharacterized protein n=1 Tax=Colocasia esculenta TaxID=4460 RepID=A0A843UQE6_COLES|nr:hypothetical protein [Colocasia esculenta]